jgi:hypothetical protein
LHTISYPPFNRKAMPDGNLWTSCSTLALGTKLVLLFVLLASAPRGKLDAGEWVANAHGMVWRASSAIPL